MPNIHTEPESPQNFIYGCDLLYNQSLSAEHRYKLNQYFAKIRLFLHKNRQYLSPQLKRINLTNPKQEDLTETIKQLQMYSVDKIIQLNPSQIELNKQNAVVMLKELVLCVINSIKAPAGYLITTKTVYKSHNKNTFQLNYLSALGCNFIMNQAPLKLDELLQIYPYIDSKFKPFHKQTYQQQTSEQMKEQYKKQMEKQFKQKIDEYYVKLYLKSKAKSLAVILLQIITKKNICKELLKNDSILGSHHYFQPKNIDLLTQLIANLPSRYQNLLIQNKRFIEQTQIKTGFQFFKFFETVLVKQEQIQWRQLITMNIFTKSKIKYYQQEQINYYHMFKVVREELKMYLIDIKVKQNQDFTKILERNIENNKIKKQFKRNQLKKCQVIMPELCKFMHRYILSNLDQQQMKQYFLYGLNDFTTFIPFYCKLSMDMVIQHKDWSLVFKQANQKALLTQEVLYQKFEFLVKKCEQIFEEEYGYQQDYQDSQSNTLINNSTFMISFRNNNFYVNLTTLLSVFLRNNSLQK